MIIYDDQLMEPTPEQLAEGIVPLQAHWWTEDNPDQKRVGPYAPTIGELTAFMTHYDIPDSAKIEYYECGSHTISLEWKVDKEDG